MPALRETVDGAFAIRPFDARSLALSLLLGLPDPVLSARSLVAIGELFAIAPGTMRTALSRMAARGEVIARAGDYRLTGQQLARKVAQDTGRRAAPARWDGTWWMVAVSAGGRQLASRRAFRTAMANARVGELRPEVWMRPANLPGPPLANGLVVVRGPLASRDPARLVRSLWPLHELAAVGRRLEVRLAGTAADVAAAGDSAALPGAITLAAAIVRYLRADPLLPPALAPDDWPGDALRERYRTFDRDVGRLLARTLRTIG